MYAPNLTDGELASIIRELAVEVATQDHRATAFCCFTVQEKVVIEGVDPEYVHDNTHHYLEDGEIVEPKDDTESSNWAMGDFGGRVIESMYSAAYWQNIAMCFTQKDADAYIATHQHNLGECRVYCASGHRNHEWQLLTEFLTRYGKTGQVPT